MNHEASSGSASSSGARSASVRSTRGLPAVGGSGGPSRGPPAPTERPRALSKTLFHLSKAAGGEVPRLPCSASASATAPTARAGGTSIHGSFCEARSDFSSSSSRFFVIAPPATSRIPAVSLTMSEQRAVPPKPPSKSTHTAREPVPSIPENHARPGCSGRRSTTARRGGLAGTVTPCCESR